VRAGRASCRLPTLPVDDFPGFHRSNEGAIELTFDAAAFAAGLRAVASAMATDQIRYDLCGALLRAGRLVATDGHRLALKTVATDPPPSPDIIIPAPTVMRLLPLLRGVNGTLAVTVSRTQIIIGMSASTLTSKVVDGTFPDYSGHIPERSSCPLLVHRKALRSAAALVAKVGLDDGEKVRGVRLVRADAELMVESAGDVSLGDCAVAVALECEPPSGMQPPAAVNPRYLLSALDAVDAELVEVHIIDAPQRSVWICAAGEGHDGTLIAQMRW